MRIKLKNYLPDLFRLRPSSLNIFIKPLTISPKTEFLWQAIFRALDGRAAAARSNRPMTVNAFQNQGLQILYSPVRLRSASPHFFSPSLLIPFSCFRNHYDGVFFRQRTVSRP